MQLARGTARRREITVRLAPGSSPWRLVRLLVVESALLAVAGGVLGIIFAKWAGTLMVAPLSTGNRPITFDGQ